MVNLREAQYGYITWSSIWLLYVKLNMVILHEAQYGYFTWSSIWLLYMKHSCYFTWSNTLREAQYGYITWSSIWLLYMKLNTCTFVIYRWIILGLRNVSDITCRDNNIIYFVINNIFRKSCHLWDNVEAKHATGDNNYCSSATTIIIARTPRSYDTLHWLYFSVLEHYGVDCCRRFGGSCFPYL